MSFCAVHAETPATLACRRCGTFACEGCAASDLTGLCEPCAARVSFVRGPVSVGSLLSESLSLLRQNAAFLLGVVVLGTLLDRLVTTMMVTPAAEALTSADPDDLARSLAEIGLSLGLSLGLNAVTWAPVSAVVLVVLHRTAVGEPVSVGAAIRSAAPRFVPLILQYVFVSVVVGAGTVMCLFPGLALSALFAAASSAVVLEGQGAFRALGRSARLVVPVFWTVLAANVVLLIPLALSIAASIVWTTWVAPDELTVERLDSGRQWLETLASNALALPLESFGLLVWARLRRASPPEP